LQVAFAKQLSLSAITGEGIYNFGEVVALPIFDTLRGRDDCAWLLALMLALKAGKLSPSLSVCS
jgi:26S proteasome regulatory subunit N9